MNVMCFVKGDGGLRAHPAKYNTPLNPLSRGEWIMTNAGGTECGRDARGTRQDAGGT